MLFLTVDSKASGLLQICWRSSRSCLAWAGGTPLVIHCRSICQARKDIHAEYRRGFRNPIAWGCLGGGPLSPSEEIKAASHCRCMWGVISTATNSEADETTNVVEALQTRPLEPQPRSQLKSSLRPHQLQASQVLTGTVHHRASLGLS